MTDDEINVAVAEACGWTEIIPNAFGKLFGANEKSTVYEMVPDYCGDLNACAEMRKALNREQRKRFAKDLAFACNPQAFVDFWDCRNEFDLWRIIDASPRLQCEIFLRVLDKWPTPASPETTAS